MIQRNSNDVDFSGGQSNAAYAQANGGYSGPKTKKSIGDGGASANSALLQTILGAAKGLMDTGLKTSREEAYLAGAAKAATGEAEESLESSFTTKDWATAGYRDTAGKLKMADAESDLPNDMQRLRQESPERMAEYLAERRAKLAPSLDGMSREQRTAAFGQMLLSDRAAIATHAKEYAAFQVEQIVTTKQAEFSTYKTKLDMALKSGDGASYDAEVKNFTLGFVGGSIMNEPRFDNAMRQKLAVQAIDDALGSGNVKVYEALQATVVPDDITKPDGPAHSVLSTLSMDNQRKLSDSYRAAYNATEGARDLDLHNETSYIKAAISEGTYKGGVDGIIAQQKKILIANKNNGAAATSLMDHFLAAQAKTHPDIPGILSDLVAGDFTKLDARNVSVTQAVEFLDKEWAKSGLTADKKIPILIGMLGTGNSVIANKLGGIMDGVVRSFSFSTDMTPANQATLKGMLGYIDTLEASGGKEAALAQVYAGMSADTALRVQRLRNAGATQNPQDAIVAVRELERRDSIMNPTDKAAAKVQSSKEVNDYLDGITPMGQWARFKAYLTPFGATAAQADLSPKTSMWSSESDNADITNKFVVDSQMAVRERLNDIVGKNVDATPARSLRMAEEATLRSTVMVGNSPLIVPKGKTPVEYFSPPGTKLVASPEQLGKAIEAVTPKTDPSNRMTYTVNGNTVLVTEFNSSGAATGNSYNIDRSAVAKEVARQQDGKKAETSAAYGTGVAIPLGDKMLTINGDNTAAMSNENMVTVRKNLSKYEGFTKGIRQDVGKQKDKDGNDVTTTGVGISSTNTFYKEAAAATTPEQHLEVFRKASNEAATNGMRLTKALGLRGDSWQVLLTEIIYQAGIGNVTGTTSKDKAGDKDQVARSLTYSKFLSSKEPADQIALLEETPVYKMSQPSRQRHYRALIQQAVQGG